MISILSSMCSSAKTWPFRPSRSRANLGNHQSPIQGMQDSWPFFSSLEFTFPANLLTVHESRFELTIPKRAQTCRIARMSSAGSTKVRQVTKWPYNHCHSPGLRPEAWLEGSVFFLCMLYANSMMVLEIENVLLESYCKQRARPIAHEWSLSCRMFDTFRYPSIIQYPTNNETATEEWICNFSVMQNSKTPWGVDQDARMQTLDKSFGV